MKYLIIGMVLSIIGTAISLIFWGIDKIYYATSCIGFVLLGVCLIFSGTLGSGEQMRANYATETRKDRQNRIRFVTNVILMAIPNLAVAVTFYLLVNKGWL